MWQDYRSDSADVYAARVSKSGTVLDTSGIAVCTALRSQVYPAVTYNPINSHYFLVWQDYQSGNAEIYGARMDTSGAILDPGGFLIYSGGILGIPGLVPQVIFDGTNYIVLFNAGDIAYKRVSTGGTVLDASPIWTSTGSSVQISLTFDGAKYFYVFASPSNDAYGDSIVKGDTLNSGGEFLLTDQTGVQKNPYTTYGSGNQFLITYTGFAPSPYGSERIWCILYPSPAVGVEEQQNADCGMQNTECRLRQNYPNPFRETTEIRYVVGAPEHQSTRTPTMSHEPRAISHTTLKIYNVAGQLVKTLVGQASLPAAGIYTCRWDGKDESGKQVSAGVYFYRLTAGNFTATKKMILVR
ncbi:MAG: FlgD immunoglobulin-like domain containing protein [Candidatus Edwardsbacteria bacterium]